VFWIQFITLELKRLINNIAMRKFYFLVAAVMAVTFSFGQTTIFDISGGGSLPSGWTGTNNVTAQPIVQTAYFLTEAGSPSDIITTAIYDLSSYSSVTFTLDVATYSSGANNAAKIEFSFDGGSTYTQTEISATPTSSTYIAGGSFNLSSTTSQVQIRISNNGSSERGVRLQNLKLVSNDIVPSTNSLTITGVYDGPLSGGIPKGIELYVINDIPDLSIFGIGSANNGEGTDGEEFTFPVVSATAGDYIFVSSESTGFTSFFGFAPNYTDFSMGINGDDAIELFERGLVIDLFGVINVDGTGQVWEYLDGWAYRNAVGPSVTFNLGGWVFKKESLVGETTNASSVDPFPIGTYDSSVLSVVKNEIENFALYPNPVSNGSLFMNSKNSNDKQVAIYTLTGKQVYSKKVIPKETMNISNLTKGIYLVKITEEGKIATRKLVVN